jgi:hypothetical protein
MSFSISIGSLLEIAGQIFGVISTPFLIIFGVMFGLAVLAFIITHLTDRRYGPWNRMK